MTLTPKLSVVSDTPAAQSAIGDQRSSDARLTAAERQLVTYLLTRLEESLSVDGLMFLANGAEHKARRKQAEEASWRA